MGEATWAGREEVALMWLRRHAPAWGIDPAAVRVDAVPNWGGFVNASYHVDGGGRRWHLKLAGVDAAPGLRTWSRVHQRLSSRYRAPRMIGSGEVAETGGWGALFDHVTGSGARGLAPRMASELLAMLSALHADGALADALTAAGAFGAPETLCRDHYLENHDRRFRADLESIADGLAFLDVGDLEWMWAEVEALASHVRGMSAFQERTRSPVHGDLWADNLLVALDGSWHVVDWDDLRIGDPVVDYATVLGPAPHDLRPVDPSRLPSGLSLDAAARDRLATYARATLLDWVIDPLADWAEAHVASADAPPFRAEKERVHKAAKALYRERWG
jgi:aminoglycoside phosphotransferase (APT) family kinase protein